jgi:hypothetical protein
MPVVMALRLVEISEAPEFHAIVDYLLRDHVSHIVPFGRMILVATFIPPSKRGSIYVPQKSQQEGQYQGNIGLVLKLGESAFKFDGEAVGATWEGPTAKVGDYVMFKFSNSREFYLNGVSVRWIEDRAIEARVDGGDLAAYY